MLIKEAEAERRREAAVTLDTGTNPPEASSEILQQKKKKTQSVYLTLTQDASTTWAALCQKKKKILTHWMFSIQKSETAFLFVGSLHRLKKGVETVE